MIEFEKTENQRIDDLVLDKDITRMEQNMKTVATILRNHGCRQTHVMQKCQDSPKVVLLSSYLILLI
jgi:hypothetical protein